MYIYSYTKKIANCLILNHIQRDKVVRQRTNKPAKF